MLLFAIAAAAALPPDPLRDFGDWTVGCDNGRSCQAVALRPESAGDEGPPYWTLSARRGGEPGAPPTITIAPAFDAADQPLRLVADGMRTQFAFDAAGAAPAGTQAVRLLRTIARSRSLDLADARGKIVGRLSPRGASAALRWMDEQQRRTGTTSAILAIGPRAASPLAPRMPRIVPPPHSAKAPRRLAPGDIATIRQRYECGRVADGTVAAYRLDAATSLAIVPCMLHAYQASSIAVVLGDGGRWRPAPLERRFAAQMGEGQPEWMTEPDYDPKARSLWTSYKGRGLGDCGGTESYVWDGQRFRLAYLEVMHRCGGSRERISLWRTANYAAPLEP